MKRIQLEGRSDLKSEIPLETPYTIFIDPSSVCNFNCKFCMNKYIPEPKFMSYAVYLKLIKDLDEFEKPVKVIRLYGLGEPMLNQHFIDMVTVAKKSSKVLAVDTTTNGSKLSIDYNKKLIDSGIDRINISIEGMNSSQYKKFTGRKIDFKRLCKNIEHLYKNKTNLTIFAKINGDYLTDEEKEKFIEIFKPITDGCNIEYTMNCWYDIDVPDKNEELGVYGQKREEVDICPYIFYSMMVHADGICSVCFLDWKQRMIIGDTHLNSIKEIWGSEAFNSFRIDMLNGKKNQICMNCDQLKAGMPVNLDPYREKLLERF